MSNLDGIILNTLDPNKAFSPVLTNFECTFDSSSFFKDQRNVENKIIELNKLFPGYYITYGERKQEPSKFKVRFHVLVSFFETTYQSNFIEKATEDFNWNVNVAIHKMELVNIVNGFYKLIVDDVEIIPQEVLFINIGHRPGERPSEREELFDRLRALQKERHQHKINRSDSDSEKSSDSDSEYSDEYD
jgi:hypothetical protein